MSAFVHLPLGQRIPASLHGVSCSLPTMRAVIGYEEKDPEITQHLTSGYPRFVQHPFLKQASAHILKESGLADHELWLTSSVRAAEACVKWLTSTDARVLQHDGLTGVTFTRNAETYGRAKTFLQNTGAFLSSREAEDYLLRIGLLSEAQAETSFDGYPAARVKGAVARACQRVTTDHVFLANSGMNAVYAAFRVVTMIQRKRGRTAWIQLGWLYLDTIAILQKYTDHPARDCVFKSDVFDLAGLKALFAERGQEIAGVITEFPTNPLLQSTDLAAVNQLCRSHGAMMIVDPSVVSPLNVDVLPHADISVFSLTKYAASEGDVLAGAAVVNPASPWAKELQTLLPGELEPVYSRDLGRLAVEIGDYETVVADINRSVPQVIAFLRTHPRITSLFWSTQPNSAENYLKVARSPEALGGMISFTVDGPIAAFYDRLRLPKGPSFGIKTSLICPFIYLAHYDLVTSESGREVLRTSGLDPDLLRLCVGCEPVEDIIDALHEALA